MTTKLRLGPLPRNETVKITLVLPIKLKEDLDRYSELHGNTWGVKVNAESLIPHMLEAFIARDRAFHKLADLRQRNS